MRRTKHEKRHLILGLALSASMLVSSLTGAVSVLADSTAEAAAYEGPEYSLQLGHIGAEGSIEDTVANRFTELVSEKSGGKIDVTIYGNSQMGGLNDLVDALRYNTLDMAIFAMGNAESYFPKSTVIALPYLFSGYDHVEAFYESDAYAALRDELAETTNLRELGAFHVGFRVILGNKKIEKAEDLKGITMRVPEAPAFVTTFGALGCNTIALPASEVYQALQTGLIEATEAAPTYMLSMNYQEVSKYCSVTNHIYTGNGLYISQSKLDSLDPAAAEVVKEAAEQASKEAWAIVADETDAAMKAFEDSGVEVIDVDLESFTSVMTDVWTALKVDDIEGGRELLETIQGMKP
ncbi:MAG: TRAP transporter substrate-binding protein [Lachnospiraceae bacterium]|nr:TRAP transporter substrate-binding protein [Lachnospiraceae bacterium]